MSVITVKSTKPCRICEEVKPLDQYSPHKSNRDGHRTKCKACCAAWQADYRARNPGLNYARVQAFKKAHPERALEIRRKSDEKYTRAAAHYTYRVTCPDGWYYLGCTDRKLFLRMRAHMRPESTTTLTYHIVREGLVRGDLMVDKLEVFDTKEEAFEAERALLLKHVGTELCLNKRLC